MKRKRPEHQRLLNDRRWKEVKRIVWQRERGLCQRCKREGRVTPGVDCHHVVPFESGKTTEEMERLCYDTKNVQLLCVACHIQTHKEMRKNTTENVMEREAQRFERWKKRIANNKKERR